MELITLEDVTDEIVTCEQSDVDEANDYLVNMAKRLNVKETKIITPPAYTVKRLGVVYALYICCVRNIGKDNLTSLDTESTRNDIYAQKAKFYKEELARLEKGLSAFDFTGKTSDGVGGVVSVPVWRA